jgi:hypothetical protein
LNSARPVGSSGAENHLRGEFAMRLPIAFDPIEVGEVDTFAFDFTLDVGSATIVSTNWTCTLAPFQTGTDVMPQARILATRPENIIQLRSPIEGTLQTRTGAFSVATIGGMPASAIGATYILEATATLSDGRILKLNSTVLCGSPTE